MIREYPKTKAGGWTIHDVARVAGVSAKTVSRVVNGETGVGTATRARIAEIIEQVGYQPHTGARSMRCRPRDSIGVVFPASTDIVPVNQEFFVWLFGELYRLFASQGYFICWDLHPPGEGDMLNYARGLWQQRYGGCAIVGPLSIGDRTVRRIHEGGYPYVALSRLDSLPEVSHAAVDYEEGMYVSTRYLLQRGHKHVAMLKAFGGYHPSIERERGYLRAIEEAGLEPSDSLVRSVTFRSRDIANETYRLLLDPQVTAVVDSSATEDAESIREGARRAGRTPGKDFEIVCWTYTPNAAVMSEACAHIWLPVREAASEGFELLAKWFREEREGPIQVLYRPTLFETHSGEELTKPKRLFETIL